MVPPTADPDLAEFFRLKICPGCDYSLESLPKEGICPECGRYDQRYIVLIGKGRGWFDSIAGGTWRGVAGFLICIGVFIFSFKAHPGILWNPNVGAWMILMAVLVVSQSYAKLFSPRDPKMQLWLSASGIAQVASTAEARQAARIGHHATYLVQPLFFVLMVFALKAHPGPVLLSLCVVAFAIPSIYLWLKRKRYARLDDHNYIPGLWPWSKLELVDVRALSEDRVRVRCRIIQTWGKIKLSKQWVADIELECPKGVASKLNPAALQSWSQRSR